MARTALQDEVEDDAFEDEEVVTETRSGEGKIDAGMALEDKTEVA